MDPSAGTLLQIILYSVIVGATALFFTSKRNRIENYFSGKVVWITGASSGIGRELAKQLAIRSPSTRLILSARREDELNNLVKELQLDFEQCLVLPLDLELQHDCFKSKIDLALQKFDQVDVLINNAGISQRSSIVETSYNVDVRLMNINYLGTITLTKAILPHFIERKQGHFVVISSVVGYVGSQLRSSYAASKHALHGFFESLRLEHVDDNINVTMVCPGFIRTDISRNALKGSGVKHGEMDPKTDSGTDPSVCAFEILKSVSNCDSEVYTGSMSSLIYIRRFFPRLLIFALSKMTNDEDSLPIDSTMVERWTNQWKRQLGFNDEQLIKRNQKVEEFAMLVLERIKTKKINDITKREQILIEALREYEHRLSQTGFENDIEEDFQTMKLKQKELFIERKHQELDLREEKFIKELDRLSKSEQILCAILTAEQTPSLEGENLLKRIERLTDYLQTLENLKNERLNNLKSYRHRLKTFCDQLDFQTDPRSKATELIDENYENCLTTEALRQIESLLDDLEKKVEEQQAQINKLISTIEKLYDKLSRDESTAPKRSTAYILRHNTVETLRELENEVKELQEKRLATSQSYCKAMKAKIEELQELCRIGCSEKKFIDFDKITADTMDECDAEIDRLEKIFPARKPVLDAFDQWKTINQQYNDFLIKSSSAARFHERGYSAVKEQAERKRFLTAVPKAERTCAAAIELWEKENPNEQFLINDQPIRQLFSVPLHSVTSNTSTMTKTVSSSSIAMRPQTKTQNRKKSIRSTIKQTTIHDQTEKTQHTQHEDDTFEFTRIENVKHINGLPRVITSTPKTGKSNQNHTVVDTGRNKANDPIQKRRPSKRVIPARR